MPSPGKFAGPKSRLKGIGLLISVICLGTAGVLYHQSLRASEETDAYLSASRTTSPSPYQDSNGIQTRRVLDVHAQLSREEDASPKWQQTAEASFQKGLQRRHQALQQLINAPFNPWDISRGVYIWDWFSPDFVCPTMERIGRLGDGGKWICDVDNLQHQPEPCVMYSFGVRDDVTFEMEMIERTGCEVHAFDPSVGGLPHYAKSTSGLHYHKAALGAHSGADSMWPVADSLQAHMKKLGHSKLSVLKIDCEGCEWDVFENLLESGVRLPFDQLLVELHLENATDSKILQDKMFKLFEGLETNGFRSFAREANLGPTLTGQLPVACEYSFIKNSMLHLPLNKPAPELVSLPVPIKAAIYVLVNPSRLSQLATMLQQLHTNFNHKYKYPIVLFHNTVLSTEQQAKITRNQEWSWIQFVAVDISLSALEPAYDAKEIPEATECAPTRIGYRNMCRFHAIEASKKLSSMGFEWHWRLDDDSRLPDPVGYDVFEMMATNKMLYGYVDVVQEESKCVNGLWELGEQHIINTRTKPKFFWEWPQGAVFYNNFELSHASVWESPEVQAWMDTVRESRGIYLYRWGDAPIRTLAVSMFVDSKRVHRFSDMAYSHAPFTSQQAASLPILGLGVIQSAFCTHIPYWDTSVANVSNCVPLLPHKHLKYYMSSDTTNRKQYQLGDGLATSCKPTHLSPSDHAKCALVTEKQIEPHTTMLGTQQLHAVHDDDLSSILAIQNLGIQGTDIASSIELPSVNGSRRILWLLGDTPWGSYNPETCSRRVKAMPRNMMAITTGEHSMTETCFHFKQGSNLVPVDLFQPPGHTNKDLHQQHWWWLFTGFSYDGKLYLLGSDFWLAPHTMWSSQGTFVSVVHNPDAPIHDWKLTRSQMNQHLSLHWYSGVAIKGDWVYLMGSLEDETNMRKFKTPHGEEVEKGLVMSRILATNFALLKWDSMEYWDGTQWNLQPSVHQQEIPKLAPVIYHTGGGETSLQYSESLGVWYMLFVEQHDHSKIMLHYSKEIEGPWKALKVYQPPAPFTDTKHYMCYAAKAHPELAQQDEIVFSYVCTKRPWTWPGMTNVYVPQFMRVKITTTVVNGSPKVNVLRPEEEAVVKTSKQKTFPRVAFAK